MLGELQDTVVTREQCRRLGLAAFAAGENAFTYGLLHGLEQGARGPGRGGVLGEGAHGPARAESGRVSLVGLLGFVTVVLLALLLLQRLPVVAAGPQHHRPGRVRRGLTAAPRGARRCCPALAIGLRGTLPRDAAAPLDWVAYSWLGVAFYLFLTLLVLEPVRLARLVAPNGARADRERGMRGRAEWGPRARAGTAAVLRPTGERLLAAVRPGGRDVIARGHAVDALRSLLARGLAVTAGAVALGTAGTGAYIANSAPSSGGCRSRCPAWTRRWTGCGSSRSPTPTCRPPTADGASSGWWRSSTASARTSSRSSATRRRQRRELREDVAPLADLVSEQGVFFVTGNHEYFVGHPRWLRHLPHARRRGAAQRAGARSAGRASFDLAGIDDRTAAAPAYRARARTSTPRWTAATTSRPSSSWPTSR